MLITNEKRVGQVTSLEMVGRLDKDGSKVLGAALANLLSRGQRQVVINMGEVRFIDSAGTRTLMGWQSTVKKYGAKIVLFNLTKPVKREFQITELHTVFDVYADEDVAIRSFAPAEESRPKGSPTAQGMAGLDWYETHGQS